jgi:AcrR family transcriptional regulator
MARGRATAKVQAPVRAPAQEPEVAEKPSGPRSSKGVRTRERLVEAAKEIFEENGFLEARISDISERAGQSHGTFYYYFDSKEEVFREVAANLDEKLFAPMEEVILAHTRMAPKQRIREAMRRHFESYKKEARMMGLIEHVARYDPEVNAMRLARHARYTEQVAKSIRQLQRAKLADTKLDPMITAAALGSMTFRFAEMWLVHGAVNATVERAIEQIAYVLENALQLKDPPKRG